MKIKILKLDERAVIPRRAYTMDAGLDLVAIETKYMEHDGILQYRTGLAIEIPEGYCGLLIPRSSIYKTRNWLVNSVGVLDAGYHGEILLNFDFRITDRPKQKVYKAGDRVAQLLILRLPEVEIVEVSSFKTKTDRGEAGFGSSGE